MKLDLIPNATYSWNQERRVASGLGEADSQPDAGITVKYGITSTVTLDGTVNPPTSVRWRATPSRSRSTSAIPVFYGEKRPFFMEGMGLFDIAGTGGDGNMRTAVHTRRIIDPL